MKESIVSPGAVKGLADQIANIEKTTSSSLSSDGTTGIVSIPTSLVPSTGKILTAYSTQSNRILMRIADRDFYMFDATLGLVKGGSCTVKVIYSE